jgi:hypothetical protein
MVRSLSNFDLKPASSSPLPAGFGREIGGRNANGQPILMGKTPPKLTIFAPFPSSQSKASCPLPTVLQTGINAPIMRPAN